VTRGAPAAGSGRAPQVMPSDAAGPGSPRCSREPCLGSPGARTSDLPEACTPGFRGLRPGPPGAPRHPAAPTGAAAGTGPRWGGGRGPRVRIAAGR